MKIDQAKSLNSKRIIIEEHWFWRISSLILTIAYTSIFLFIGCLLLFILFGNNLKIGHIIFFLVGLLFNLSLSTFMILSLIKYYSGRTIFSVNNIHEIFENPDNFIEPNFEIVEKTKEIIIAKNKVAAFRWSIWIFIMRNQNDIYIKTYSETNIGSPNPTTLLKEKKIEKRLIEKIKIIANKG